MKGKINGERFTRLIQENGNNAKLTAELLGIDRKVFYRLKRGGSCSLLHLEMIANYFGVTTDYLLGRD